MSRLTRVLLVVALVVPPVAYLAGSLAGPGGPEPADRGPVILRDATPTTTPAPTPPAGDRQDQQGPARVVTPVPTPVGEDGDDQWDDERDDDGPDDDDTDDERDD
jgi:hypothetical protein